MNNLSSTTFGIIRVVGFLLLPFLGCTQINWTCVDNDYGPLPKTFHVYYTEDKIDTGSFRAFYCIVDPAAKHLKFQVDTTLRRRLTPDEFYMKNDHPLLVVNTTFFSFETNRNLNVVIRNGKSVSFNQNFVPLKGKDSLMYHHPFGGAFGINRYRRPDIAWVSSDSSNSVAYASQRPVKLFKDSSKRFTYEYDRKRREKADRQFINTNYPVFIKWPMTTAVGGGPVLIYDGKISITNNEELRFDGKAIADKHPRTVVGITKEKQVIILVVEGRTARSGGATLQQAAVILKDLGCVEALNLDGGGSSCLLINGKPTITVSDKGGQRPVPCVLMIEEKKLLARGVHSKQ